MKALQGIEGQLEWAHRAAPACAEGEVRIRVAAAGLNRADLLQRAGHYPPPAGVTDILGLECAGVVSEVNGRSRWKVGDRVCALLAGGGMAEEVVVDARHALPVPDGLSLHEAAVIPEVYATAWLNLYRLGALLAGDKVLLHAGASGVGTAGIQLAKQFGAVVAVTVGSDAKAQDCYALGADICINYKTQDFVSELQKFRPQGFNVIVDPVAADYISKDLQVLALDGRIVVLAMMGGRQVPAFDLALMFKKRGQLICSTLRNRTDAYKAQLTADFSVRFGQALAQGQIKPVLAQVFDWQDAAAAHQILASNAVTGKLVLQVSAVR